EVGAKGTDLFEGATAVLLKIVQEKLLTAKAVYGFFPANSVGDDIELYTDDTRATVRAVFHTLRQQGPKPEGLYNQALADFIAPKESGVPDYLGAFAVTSGGGIESLCHRFQQEHDDYNAIMSQALADRLAEG